MWIEQRQIFLSKQKDLQIEKEKNAKLLKDIHTADFNEDWQTVVTLSKIYLQDYKGSKDKGVQKYLEKAKEKMERIVRDKNVADKKQEIENFITLKEWSKAKNLIAEFRQKFPEFENDAKNFSKKIFEKEDGLKIKSSYGGKTIGSSPKPLSKDTNKAVNTPKLDDFFNGEASKIKTQNKLPIEKHGTKKCNSKDDFFDAPIKPIKKDIKLKKSDKSTNIDDFFK